ncbi:hypothetical protein E2C01_071813 [Portunus trituberculatus]|uniref:Uncharacterized protein n=1 Tax=Portunus trituberculatus TaxID=210409 RepID=A0A5B7HW88_PORTR|nr:hypothetical protein [Portunus trituberculatus]
MLIRATWPSRAPGNLSPTLQPPTPVIPDLTWESNVHDHRLTFSCVTDGAGQRYRSPSHV